MHKFLDLKKQYVSIKKDIDEAIQRVVDSSIFIGGPEVASFEKKFSKFCDSKFCVGVGNGTDALEIAMEALSLPKNSEIIVPANSFIASSEAVTRVGSKVVFVDCNPDTHQIEIKDVKRKITNKTSAIVAVHLYGNPAPINEIKSAIEGTEIKIIEDCAQAHGAKYFDKRVGSLGHISAFSFYPGKNLGAYGDGGAILTNDEDLYIKSKMIANHGRINKYDHKFEGRNSRLDSIQAAILSVKLAHLENWINKRNRQAQIYNNELRSLSEINLMKVPEENFCAYHLYVIRTLRRDQLSAWLKSNDIQTGIHYPVALPKLSSYEYLRDSKYKEMYAYNAGEQLLSLPIGEHLEETHVREIANCVKDFFE